MKIQDIITTTIAASSPSSHLIGVPSGKPSVDDDTHSLLVKLSCVQGSNYSFVINFLLLLLTIYLLFCSIFHPTRSNRVRAVAVFGASYCMYACVCVCVRKQIQTKVVHRARCPPSTTRCVVLLIFQEAKEQKKTQRKQNKSMHMSLAHTVHREKGRPSCVSSPSSNCVRSDARKTRHVVVHPRVTVFHPPRAPVHQNFFC